MVKKKKHRNLYFSNRRAYFTRKENKAIRAYPERQLKKPLKPLRKKKKPARSRVIKRRPVKVRERVKRGKKKLALHVLYQSDVPFFSIPEDIAERDSDETFLLNYKEGRKININIRLQFKAETFSENFDVTSSNELKIKLVDFRLNTRPLVLAEIKWLQSQGIEISMLTYRCTAYVKGKNKGASLIEIIYP